MSPRNTRVSRHPRSGTRGVRSHTREVADTSVPHRDITITKSQQTRLRRFKKRLAKSNTRDAGRAEDVVMVAINDRDFYKTHSQPMIANLVRKKKQDKLRRDLAVLGWTNHVKGAIKSYNKQLKIERPQVEPIMYSPEVKAQIAKQLNDHYYPDIKRGNYD